MITDNRYFTGKLLEINKEITLDNQKVELKKKCSIYDFSKKNITERFNQIFKVFPYEIETASETIGISYYTKELFDLYYEISEPDGTIEQSKINESKENFKNQDVNEIDGYLIIDFLEDYFHTITYFYGDVINNTKKHHFFYGIEKEEIILFNLLKLYRSILEDKTKQLQVFWGITLTKKIADLVTEMLLDFIEQRLLVLNPSIKLEVIPSKTTFVDNTLKPIEWLGTQQELIELFFELEKNRWIPEIKKGERKQIANSILRFFDIDNTKRKEKSKVQDSFYQQFKGELMEGERDFNFFDSKKYERKFEQIKKNSRQNRKEL